LGEKVFIQTLKKRDFKNTELDDQSIGWQTTYSSLALILVVVFVMLVSYSVVDRNKMSRLKNVVAERATGIAKNPLESRKSDESTWEKGLEKAAWIDDAMLSLKNAGASFGIEKNLTIQRHESGIRLRLNSDIVYPSGSAEIKEVLFPVLDQIFSIADKRHLFLRVAGYTDDVPIATREFPSNWELSTKRATNIVRYFIEKKGMSPKHLSAEGFSQYQPLRDAADPEARKHNRRIEIYMEPAPQIGSIRGRLSS
jgi:chemotaxis protein MotB